MARACSSAPNRFGNAGRYLKVRNCASENGLSWLTRGREWLAAMPRSASIGYSGEPDYKRGEIRDRLDSSVEIGFDVRRMTVGVPALPATTERAEPAELPGPPQTWKTLYILTTSNEWFIGRATSDRTWGRAAGLGMGRRLFARPRADLRLQRRRGQPSGLDRAARLVGDARDASIGYSGEPDYKRGEIRDRLDSSVEIDRRGACTTCHN